MTVSAVGAYTSPWEGQANGPGSAPADSEQSADSGQGTPADQQEAAAVAPHPGIVSYRQGMSMDDVLSPRAKTNLNNLAATLGADPATLLAHVTSGQSLSSLLANGADAGYGTALARSTGGGIAIDQYA